MGISVSHVVLGQAKPAREQEFRSCGKQSLGLGRRSVDKVLAEQAQGPELDPQNPRKKPCMVACAYNHSAEKA